MAEAAGGCGVRAGKKERETRDSHTGMVSVAPHYQPWLVEQNSLYPCCDQKVLLSFLKQNKVTLGSVYQIKYSLRAERELWEQVIQLRIFIPPKKSFYEILTSVSVSTRYISRENI